MNNNDFDTNDYDMGDDQAYAGPGGGSQQNILPTAEELEALSSVDRKWFFGERFWALLTKKYPEDVSTTLVDAFFDDPQASVPTFLSLLDHPDEFFVQAEALFKQLPKARTVTPPPLPSKPDNNEFADLFPSVPTRRLAKPDSVPTSAKRKAQLRDAKRRARKKQRQEAFRNNRSRSTLPLPSSHRLVAPIVHAQSVDIDAVRSRLAEIEHVLGIGVISKTMLLRREQQRATRDRVIMNLESKLVAEKARKTELEATKPLEEEAFKLFAMVSSTKSVRKDQRDGGLLESDTDSDGGEGLFEAPQESELEARLASICNA